MRKEIRQVAESTAKLQENIKGVSGHVAQVEVNLSKEISGCKDELRKDIGKVSARVARIEGRLGPPAPVPKTQQSAKAG